MTDTGNKDRFERWFSGFEENVKHEPSSASRSKKAAQLQELEWRKKIAGKNLQILSSDSSLEAGAAVKEGSTGAEIKDETSSKLIANIFKKPPLASWPKSVSSGDSLLELMVEEMTAITSNALEDLQIVEDERLLKELENARSSVVKFVTANHRGHLTKSVMRGFTILANIQINRVGVENSERRTKQNAVNLMMKRKIADMLANAQEGSLPTFKSAPEISQLLELDDVDKKTLALLGEGWTRHYSKLEDATAEQLLRCLRRLQNLQERLKNAFDNRDLPIVGATKLEQVFEKTLQPVLDDLKSNLALEGVVQFAQQTAANWYKPVHDRVAAEEDAVSKAKKLACAKYLEFMLEKFSTATPMNPSEVTAAHSKVRERLEIAFFTAPDFLYGLLWTFDVPDEDLIEQFKKERLNLMVAAGVAEEEKVRENETARSTTLQSQPDAAESEPQPLDIITKPNLVSTKPPKLVITVSAHSKSAEQGRTVTTTSAKNSTETPDTVYPDSTEPDEKPLSSPSCSSRTPMKRRRSFDSPQSTPKRRHERPSKSPVSRRIYGSPSPNKSGRSYDRASPNTSVRVAMYFTIDTLKVMFEVDGESRHSSFPLTISTSIAPNGDIVLGDLENYSNVKDYDISAYIRDRNVMRPLGFNGIYSEVPLAAFIRKCIHHIHRTTSANLYDAFVAVALPASMLSSCRFRVKTALKLAGFRGSIFVQPSTALAMSYAANTGLMPSPYEVLTVFVDGNDIEVTVVQVTGWEFTAVDVKIIHVSNERTIEPQDVVDATFEYKRMSHFVFSMSGEKGNAFAFSQALKRSFGHFLCKPLHEGLLPGLLAISSGRTQYKERFPWQFAVGRHRFLLAEQNAPQPPAERPAQLVFKLHEVEGDEVTIFRRDGVYETEVEEVSLQKVNNLYRRFREGDVSVEVTNEGLVQLEVRSNQPGSVFPKPNVHDRHLTVTRKVMQSAREQVDTMAVDFPVRLTSGRGRGDDDDRRHRSLSRGSSSRTGSPPGGLKRFD